ncbi:hypothetical protein [Roseateles depolymerans]|uniref:hypothetical protein n=1 Tax=Roseateles depolymerans TaxID=76731 RepID=UPI000E3B01C4|nr:hypothetical protein [Roseateles depolymerans]REG12974.1 hypothetical protein DES44_4349 [Roseateles depolymerans]
MNIGILGGSSVYEVGTVSDTVLFFDCVQAFIGEERTVQDWSLITDRLYRRYLRLDELSAASSKMDQIRAIFETKPACSVEWLESTKSSLLNRHQNNLAEVFAKYFDSFIESCDSALAFNDAFNIYQPVRFVRSDNVWLTIEKMHSLADYEALTEKPFWLEPNFHSHDLVRRESGM